MGNKKFKYMKIRKAIFKNTAKHRIIIKRRLLQVKRYLRMVETENALKQMQLHLIRLETKSFLKRERFLKKQPGLLKF